MNIHSLGSLSQQYLQSLFGTGSASSASTSNSSSASSTSAASSSSGSGNQLSPFAQVLANLQQLEQSNPTQYSQLTSQISTNLQSAAQSAQTQGHGTLASQLTTLSKDFSTASQSGQLPNVQDLAKAMNGGHHHHRMASTQGASSDSSANAGLFQYLNQGSSMQGTAASQSLNPAAIILNSFNATTTGATSAS